MAVYIVEVTFGDLELRERVRPAHRAHMTRLVEEGWVWLTGPWEDGTGGMVIFDVPDRESLDTVLAADPYEQQGMYSSRRVTAWNPVMGARLNAPVATA